MRANKQRTVAIGMFLALWCQMMSVSEVEAGKRRTCRRAHRARVLPTRRQVAACVAPRGAVIADAMEDEGDPNWGTLRGRFVFGGESRAPGTLRNESLLVDSENQGLANVVAWIRLRRDEKIPIHPSHDAAGNSEVKLVVNDVRFEPRIAVIRTGQTLVINNATKRARNIEIYAFSNPGFDRIITDQWWLKFELPERLPLPISDVVAPRIRGWLVVNEHPYAVASGPDGCFQLRNLPVGTWSFRLWHEQSGYLEDMTIDGRTERARYGQLTLTIKPGENDLGDIVLPAAEFEHVRPRRAIAAQHNTEEVSARIEELGKRLKMPGYAQHIEAKNSLRRIATSSSPNASDAQLVLDKFDQSAKEWLQQHGGGASLKGAVSLSKKCAPESMAYIYWCTGGLGPQMISINGEHFTDDHLAYVSGLPFLGVLDIHDASITGKTLAKAVLPKLASLHLSHCPIADDVVAEMSFPKLSVLNVSHTRVTDALFPKLKTQHLQGLRVQSTAITPQGVLSILKLPQLITLRLDLDDLDERTLEVIKNHKTLKWLVVFHSRKERDRAHAIQTSLKDRLRVDVHERKE